MPPQRPDERSLPSERDLLAALAPAEEEISTSRVVCEHADRCGGCPVIGLAYGEQLAMKRGRVVASAARYPSLEMVYTEPVAPADPIIEYRTRAKLIVATGGRLGLYAKGGGHQVVDIPGCRVLSPALSRIAEDLRARIVADEARGGPLAPLDPGRSGALRAVDLREVRGEAGSQVLVTLVVQRDRVADQAALDRAAIALAADDPVVAGVAINFHEGDSPQVLGNETVVVHGAAAADDQVGASKQKATYGSFVQAHRGQAARIHALLAETLSREVDGRPRVLDLYGGSGAIALSLAAAGADVLLVESFAPAAAHAAEAAASQGLRVKAEAADVASTLRRLCDRRARFDAVVMNPPRRGVSPLARDLVARLDVPTLAYVSCDPDTLARDLDHFARLGFVVATLRPLDMIPLTDEVETIAILRRASAPAAKVLYEDEEVIIVEKGAHEPTTGPGEHTRSLLDRVRKLAGADQAVPAHKLDAGTTGVVVFVRHPELLTRWQEVLASPSARHIYVAGTRGVTPSKGAIARDLREDGKMYPARTRYRRLAVASGHSVLRVIPEQGRPHQIRRHLAAVGHPVLGDDRYGHPPTNRFFEEKNALDRTFLHCVRLELDHPGKGARMLVEAALPGDLRGVLERTSGPGTLRFLDHKHALGHGGAGPSSIPPPPPDSMPLRDGGLDAPLDIDSSTPSMRPEMIGDDDDVGTRSSGSY